MSIPGKKVALLGVGIWILKGILRAFRYSLYIALLLAGRVFRPMAGLASAGGLFMFLFCLILRRDLVLPMWVGAALAFVGAVFLILYDAALRLVAPEGTTETVFIREM